MPGHEEERKAGAGRPAHGEDEGHGKPGHRHHEPAEAGGVNAAQAARINARKKGRRQEGRKKPDDDEDTEDDDSEEEVDDEDPADDKDEAEHPGVGRAGRVAGKAWKKAHGVDGKIKDLTPAQQKEIRKVKREARMAFRTSSRQQARREERQEERRK